MTSSVRFCKKTEIHVKARLFALKLICRFLIAFLFAPAFVTPVYADKHQIFISVASSHLGENAYQPIFCNGSTFIILYQEGAYLQGLDAAGIAQKVAALPGPIDQNSLSCSTDGAWISTYSADGKYIYVYHLGALSVYGFSEYSKKRENDIPRMFSIMSRDASSFVLRSTPFLLQGADFLAKKRIFTSLEKAAFWADKIVFFSKNGLGITEYSDLALNDDIKSIPQVNSRFLTAVNYCKGSLYATIYAGLSDDLPPKYDVRALRSLDQNSLLQAQTAKVQKGQHWIVGNDKECIFVEDGEDGSMVINEEGRKLEISKEDAELFRHVDGLSSDACFLSSYRFDRGARQFVVLYNPFNINICRSTSSWTGSKAR